jgi:uncharacterized protein (TIGR00369 family)
MSIQPACREGRHELSPAPTAAEVRAWMRTAGRDQLAVLLREDPTALSRFSPAAGSVNARVLQVPRSDSEPLVVACTGGADVRNPWGNVHGGVLLALMDEVGSAAAALSAGPDAFGATTSLSATFVRPLRGQRFRIVAHVAGRSLTALTVRLEVEDAGGRLHDAALATFALRSPFARPEVRG